MLHSGGRKLPYTYKSAGSCTEWPPNLPDPCLHYATSTRQARSMPRFGEMQVEARMMICQPLRRAFRHAPGCGPRTDQTVMKNSLLCAAMGSLSRLYLQNPGCGFKAGMESHIEAHRWPSSRASLGL